MSPNHWQPRRMSPFLTEAKIFLLPEDLYMCPSLAILTLSLRGLAVPLKS